MYVYLTHVHDRGVLKLSSKINARDKANQLPLSVALLLFFVLRPELIVSSHRAATTGSVGFIRLLVESSTPSNKLRLNTADRIGRSLLR